MNDSRSTICTKANADAICTRLAAGQSLRKICQDENLPSYDTVLNWAAEDAEFGAKYDRAREIQYQRWADEIIDLSDDSSGDLNWMTKAGRWLTTRTFSVHGYALTFRSFRHNYARTRVREIYLKLSV